jgi:hypothetical protein
MKVFTAGMPDLCSSHINKLNNDVVVENNFEQIIGMAKNGELERLCIYMDVWNVFGRSFNGMRGQGAAEKIHEIDPNIPILIWDGREYDVSPELSNIPPCFQVDGKVHPIKYANETYLSFDFYDNVIDDITTKFFNGTLNLDKLAHKECLV